MTVRGSVREVYPSQAAADAKFESVHSQFQAEIIHVPPFLASALISAEPESKTPDLPTSNTSFVALIVKVPPRLLYWKDMGMGWRQENDNLKDEGIIRLEVAKIENVGLMIMSSDALRVPVEFDWADLGMIRAGLGPLSEYREDAKHRATLGSYSHCGWFVANLCSVIRDAKSVIADF